MNGLHILSTSENGSQIHFYMLLCTALLQLHLKQKCLEQNNLRQGPQTGDKVLSECQIDQNSSLPEPLVEDSKQQEVAKSEQTPDESKKPASSDCSKKASENESTISAHEPSACNRSSCVVDQSLLNRLADGDPPEEACSIKMAGLMIDPDQLAGTRGQTFLATIGSKLDRYWKISIHWLVKLRNHLHKPFCDQIMISLAAADP